MSDYRNFTFTDNGFVILHTRKTFKRTASGKSWKTKPNETTHDIICAEHYQNYVTSIPFFNNFGDGASCRASKEYTCAGYLVTQISSISPFHEKRVIDNFQFIDRWKMENKAGYREKEILKNATMWKPFKTNNGRHCIELITEDGKSMIYDYSYNVFIG